MHLDKRAIRLFLSKDEAASGYIYAKTARLVKHVAFEVLHNDADAEDAMMATYLSVLESGRSFDNAKAFLSYLCVSAKNIALNQAKRRDRVESEEDGDIHESETDPSYSSPLLADARKLLSEEDYELVVFHLCLDLSFPEIASIQGGSASSCRGRYFRALKKLRENLREEDYR